MSEPRHCDEYINDEAAPPVLRIWLDFARSPGHGASWPDPKPTLWATVKHGPTTRLEQFLRDKGMPPGTRVRVCMASRFGDVGINTTGAENGYAARVPVEALTDFGSEK